MPSASSPLLSDHGREFGLRRLLGLLLAIVALAGLELAVPVASLSMTYTYDVPIHGGSERALPAPSRDTTTYDPVVRWLHGTPSRPESPPATSITTYAYVAPPVQVARHITSTGPHVGAPGGNLWSLHGSSVAANGAEDLGGIIYRTGSRTDGALTDASGVSFRDSVSSSLSSEHPQVFQPGEKIWGVDTSQLPPGSVVRDGVPPGHVTVNATPEQIRKAIANDSFLSDLGLKPLDEFGTYRLPK